MTSSNVRAGTPSRRRDGRPERLVLERAAVRDHDRARRRDRRTSDPARPSQNWFGDQREPRATAPCGSSAARRERSPSSVIAPPARQRTTPREPWMSSGVPKTPSSPGWTEPAPLERGSEPPAVLKTWHVPQATVLSEEICSSQNRILPSTAFCGVIGFGAEPAAAAGGGGGGGPCVERGPAQGRPRTTRGSETRRTRGAFLETAWVSSNYETLSAELYAGLRRIFRSAFFWRLQALCGGREMVRAAGCGTLQQLTSKVRFGLHTPPGGARAQQLYAHDAIRQSPERANGCSGRPVGAVYPAGPCVSPRPF